MNPKWKRLLLWLGLIFSLDQLTKQLIVHFIPLGHRIPVIPNFFDLVHVTNPGAAFGIFANLPESYRFPLLAVISLFAVGMIAYYYYKLPEGNAATQIPLAMILGGAAGNLLDRFVRGEVVDFLSAHWYDRWFEGKILWWELHFRLEWPAFNVADSAISVSVVWLMVMMFRDRKAPA